MTMLPPLPVADPLTKPFWDGCREQRLLVQKCRACGSVRHPPGPVCLECRSPEADWIDSKGQGSVYSWIVVRHPIPAEVYADKVPYVVALIDLDEGTRVVSNITHCDLEAVEAGMRVEVYFRQATETVTLPQFKPVGSR